MSAHTFNLRTRSLVNLMFWLIQIPATILLKPMFDADCRRRTRALMATSYLAVIVIAVWVEETGKCLHILGSRLLHSLLTEGIVRLYACLVWLTGRNAITVNEPPLNLDWTDSAAKVGPLFAGYMLNGVIYSCWQSVVQCKSPSALTIRGVAKLTDCPIPDVISTLSNDPKLTARYAGLFKSAVSAGMTVSFGVTAAEVSFLKQLEWQVSVPSHQDTV